MSALPEPLDPLLALLQAGRAVNEAARWQEEVERRFTLDQLPDSQLVTVRVSVRLLRQLREALQAMER